MHRFMMFFNECPDLNLIKHVLKSSSEWLKRRSLSRCRVILLETWRLSMIKEKLYKDNIELYIFPHSEGLHCCSHFHRLRNQPQTEYRKQNHHDNHRNLASYCSFSVIENVVSMPMRNINPKHMPDYDHTHLECPDRLN